MSKDSAHEVNDVDDSACAANDVPEVAIGESAVESSACAANEISDAAYPVSTMISDADFEDDAVAGGLVPARAPYEDQGAPIVALTSWEGPLDLLLEAARRRQVDLAHVSMAELVDVCLKALARMADRVSVRERAEALTLAAQLTLMKSRLLLPAPADAETDEAARLRRRLEHLALIRTAGAALLARDRLGVSLFARGMPEAIETKVSQSETYIDLLDLVRTYADIRLRDEAEAPLELKRILAMSVGEALPLIADAVACGRGTWVELFAAAGAADRRRGASVVSARSLAAASFGAALEMAKRGEVDIRQVEGGIVAVRAGRGKAE